MREYITSQGDTWDLIAKKTMGSEYYLTQLIEANPAHIETVIFPGNVRLFIPDVPAPVTDPLPPWKRGSV